MNVASEHRWGYVEYYVYVKDSQKRVKPRQDLGNNYVQDRMQKNFLGVADLAPARGTGSAQGGVAKQNRIRKYFSDVGQVP